MAAQNTVQFWSVFDLLKAVVYIDSSFEFPSHVYNVVWATILYEYKNKSKGVMDKVNYLVKGKTIFSLIALKYSCQ